MKIGSLYTFLEILEISQQVGEMNSQLSGRYATHGTSTSSHAIFVREEVDVRCSVNSGYVLNVLAESHDLLNMCGIPAPVCWPHYGFLVACHDGQCYNVNMLGNVCIYWVTSLVRK
jgi:hypothetical protein